MCDHCKKEMVQRGGNTGLSESLETPGYVWAFEWLDDPYESGWRLESLHLTAKGCYSQMISKANAMWYEERRNELEYGKSRCWPLVGQAWRMRKVFLNT